MGGTDDPLTRLKFFIRILLDAQHKLQHCLVVIVKLVGEQRVNHEIPIDETNGKPGLDSCHLGRGNVFDLEELSDMKQW